MAETKIKNQKAKIKTIDQNLKYEEPVKKSAAEKFFPVRVVALVVAAFVVGAMWSKIKYLESGQGKQATQVQQVAQQTAPQPAQPQIELATIKGLFGKDLIKFGDGNRKLLLVEVADPSCPYCHAAAGKNPELSKQIGQQFTLKQDGGGYVAPVEEMRKLVGAGKASYVYIYQNGHGNGEMAQKALYCAFEKGKFWEVHDTLFTNAGYSLINNEVKNDKAQAQKLADFLRGEMNTNDLKSCLESGKFDGRILSDQQLAVSLGVQGTPGFFLNTTSFAGAYNWTDMQSVADAALK